jgi:GT2 family glycosyltransferase
MEIAQRRRVARLAAFGTASVRSERTQRHERSSQWRKESLRADVKQYGLAGGAPTIAVIIPTIQRPEMLQRLLTSLLHGTRVPDEVIVVDNDPKWSADPTEITGLKVEVVRAGLGISLAGARNVGWRLASSDICFFIDDDNVVESDTVAELARAFEGPGVGMAGPVVFAGDSGTVWCAGIYRSRWTGRTRCILGGESTMPTTSTWHTDDMPNAFAIPRDVLEDIGGFDEKRFPIHYDEADVNARIRELGLKTIVVRNARVCHYGWVGFSPGSAMVWAVSEHGIERVRQMALSRVRFHLTHSKGLSKWSAIGIFLPIWVVLTSVGCLGADATWATRLTTIRTVGAGVLSGYREALTQTFPLISRSSVQSPKRPNAASAPAETETRSALDPNTFAVKDAGREERQR